MPVSPNVSKGLLISSFLIAKISQIWNKTEDTEKYLKNTCKKCYLLIKDISLLYNSFADWLTFMHSATQSHIQ